MRKLNNSYVCSLNFMYILEVHFRSVFDEWYFVLGPNVFSVANNYNSDLHSVKIPSMAKL